VATVRRLVSEQSGVTLVELLVVIVVAGVVMGATLTAFAQFEQTTGTNQRQNESQDRVRVGLATVTRELRNLASPTDEQPDAIERNTAQDLIFQSVSSTVERRVRYCLDTAGRRLWRQLDVAPFGALPSTACPDTAGAWGTARVVAEDVVNGARPVFGYNVEDPKGITEISSTLWVDVNPGTKPLETSLQTSVFLRNQNRRPFASFTATVSGQSIILNGSESSDPEGRSLQFYWYDEDVDAPSIDRCPGLPEDLPEVGCVGSNVVSTYTPEVAGDHHIYLLVMDPAGLTHRAPGATTTEAVCVPSLDESEQCDA
jgi:prepilin-type N-terminal cleavage/methylation domain-containing protein